MQEINGVRDSLRAEVEGIDGGYTTVAKLMKKTTQHVHKTLRPDNSPRLSTLEAIRDAIDKAKRVQSARIRQLTA